MLPLLFWAGLGYLGFREYKKHHPKGHVVTINITSAGELLNWDASVGNLKAGGNFQVAIDEKVGIWALPPITTKTDNVTFAPQGTPKTPLIGQWAGGAPASFVVNWIPVGGSVASQTTVTIAK